MIQKVVNVLQLKYKCTIINLKILGCHVLSFPGQLNLLKPRNFFSLLLNSFNFLTFHWPLKNLQTLPCQLHVEVKPIGEAAGYLTLAITEPLGNPSLECGIVFWTT